MAALCARSLAFSEIRQYWKYASSSHSGSGSLSQYYSGGSLVFSGAQDEAGNVIPSSGAIKFSDFYSTHTATTGATTNFATPGTFSYTVPAGVSTLTCTLYGAGGAGGEGDESGAGGGGGGGGAGGVIQGTLTISNNIQAEIGGGGQGAGGQVLTVVVGAGGVGGGFPTSGGPSFITYTNVGHTVAKTDSGGYGGGFNNSGVSYGRGAVTNQHINTNYFSASTIVSGISGDLSQGGSGDNFSSAGTAGKAVSNDILGIGSTGGAAGTLASNSAATGGNASGFGAGGGGAASIDRTGAHHWYGGSGSGGYVRIVVAS